MSDIMAECDCGATTEGKWAGVHHPNCSAVKRRPICHGDGGEGERLYGLGVGHILTEDDVQDIQNLLADHNDEIGQTADVIYQAWQSALASCEPDKADLVKRLADLEVRLATEKALKKFYQTQLDGVGQLTTDAIERTARQ